MRCFLLKIGYSAISFSVLYYPDRYPLQLLQVTTWIIPVKITKFSVKLNVSQEEKKEHTT